MNTRWAGLSNATGFEIIDIKKRVRVKTRGYRDPIVDLLDVLLNPFIKLIFFITTLALAVIIFIGNLNLLFESSENLFESSENVLSQYISMAFWITATLSFFFGLASFLLGIQICVCWCHRRLNRCCRYCDNERIKPWHACEHKLINLLQSRKEVTLESLREMSPIAQGCSTGSRQKEWLAEPTEEQLKITLEAAEEYHRKLQKIKGS